MTDEEIQLDPPRMTGKWIARQTDYALERLAERWSEWCCRGLQIRREIERREIERRKDD